MRPRLLMLLVAATLALLASPPSAVGTAPELPLGSSKLRQSEASERLAPGVTLTKIVRGAFDPATPWVVEVAIPSGPGSPDPAAPARAIQDRTAAEAAARALTESGIPARSEQIVAPATADTGRTELGYRVRLTTTYPDRAAADAAVAQVAAAGFGGRSWYTGWDGGDRRTRGRWRVNVLTLDPGSFKGQLTADYGPDLVERETVSELSQGSTAAINGGFFVFDPAAGAPGDPAGVAVYRGQVESEPVGRRPALVLDPGAQTTAIVRPRWQARAKFTARAPWSGERARRLDGINRVPGLIRNCGGWGDQPTDLPLHDQTCTDQDELVAFTPTFGAVTPVGPGREVIVGPDGGVEAVFDRRGSALAPGRWSLQATGDRVAELRRVRVGDRVSNSLRLSAAGAGSLVRPGASVINGGPLLLRGGNTYITPLTDGFVQPGNPSFNYGWVQQRNPRTFAGTDRAGRTLLVTVDGRQVGDLGLSIAETAAVARALGMVEAINLDGGGSTAMTVGGRLRSSPSDTAGERPVGDAIVIR